ncbi:Glucosyl transferase GtrII [Butyrivibrio proteoclasticus]|uniref:Glucosyl transferase GtrII n=1 Tax=Butyrivibrio proteoclasticus TaxID=43305 RepID=A0A1I5PP34_9FIRM|nr:glucosyltransferase domain-containing protein [Butyrivibrio proteoclasticus]SFP35647.1 Glucosyl transferase GtrII [Butyrivibrio proteoclasticus]
MEIIIDKLKENRKVILYSFFLTLLFFGINYKIEYATDTYYNFIQMGAWKACLENGRPFLALCFYVLEAMPISVGMIYHIMQVLGIIFLTAGTTVLAIVYERHLEKEIESTILAFLTISNPLIIEYFLFEEKGIFMMAIFLNVLAAYITINSWERKSESISIKITISEMLLTLTCMLVAVLSYQTSVQVFVVICLPFILIYSQDITDFIKKNVYVALMYGLSMGVAFFVAKYILHTERASMSFELAEGIKRGIEIVKEVTFQKFYNLPEGIFAIWCMMLIVISAIAIIRTRASKLISLISICYICVGCIFASFFVFVLNGSALPSPRTAYTYGMIFGVVFFYSMYLQKECGKNYIPIIFSIIILAYEYLNFSSVFVDRYQCNAVDRYYAQIIREQIKEYEDETGNIVDTICFYTDADRKWWDEGYGDTELMTRAQSTGWSALNSINLYLERDYKEGQQDEELAEYFAEHNWGMYSEEQVIFKENELHLCIY